MKFNSDSYLFNPFTMKKISPILLLLFLFSCTKEEKMVSFENKVIKDTIHNVLIRPIDPELLEDTSDSIQLYYQKFNNHEIFNILRKHNRY